MENYKRVNNKGTARKLYRNGITVHLIPCKVRLDNKWIKPVAISILDKDIGQGLRQCRSFYRGKDKQIMVKCGCFNDTIDKFLEKVKSTHGNSRHALVYRAVAEVARIQIDLEGKAKESEE